MAFHNKLERLSLASISSLVQRFVDRLEPTRVEHLSTDPYNARLLALRTNIRLGWKSLLGTNALAYYENS